MRSLRIVGIALLCVVAASFCQGQQLAKKMSNQDIIEMVSLGLSDDVVIDKIHGAAATDFDTSIAGLKALKAAKVSDTVIRAMINPHPAAAPAAVAWRIKLDSLKKGEYGFLPPGMSSSSISSSGKIYTFGVIE